MSKSVRFMDSACGPTAGVKFDFLTERWELDGFPAIVSEVSDAFGSASSPPSSKKKRKVPETHSDKALQVSESLKQRIDAKKSASSKAKAKASP